MNPNACHELLLKYTKDAHHYTTMQAGNMFQYNNNYITAQGVM